MGIDFLWNHTKVRSLIFIIVATCLFEEKRVYKHALIILVIYFRVRFASLKGFKLNKWTPLTSLSIYHKSKSH